MLLCHKQGGSYGAHPYLRISPQLMFDAGAKGFVPLSLVAYTLARCVYSQDITAEQRLVGKRKGINESRKEMMGHCG